MREVGNARSSSAATGSWPELAESPTLFERPMGWLRRFLGDYLTPGELVGLLLGRLGTRLLVGVSPGVLASQWDQAETEAFAQSMGAMLFVGLLIGAGPEKAAAKLLPRHPRLTSSLVRAVMETAVAFSALGAMWVLVLLVMGEDPVLVVLGFLFLASRGAHRALLAVSRAESAPMVDLYSHLVLLPGLLAGIIAGIVTGSAEVTLAVSLIASTASVVVAGIDVARRTPERRPTRRFHRSVRRLVFGEAVRLSAGDVATAAASTVLVLVLGWTGTPAEVADFYICLSLVSVLLNGLSVVFRLIQPSVSVRYVTMRRRGGAFDGGWVARLWMPAAGYLAVVSVVVVTAARTVSGHHLAVTLVAAVLIGPLLTAASTAHFWFENRSRSSLRRANTGALVGALATAAAASPLTMAAGGAGAVLAMTIGSVAHLVVLAGAGGPAPGGPAVLVS